ncbi:MAG: M50 family metallopeptidase [Anaerolineales bacterium]
MISDKSRLFRLSLFLFGSFAIGYNLATAVHELGHAIVIWATGGTVARIVLHPFTWSYTYYSPSPGYPILTSWAGILFESLLALLLAALVWRWRQRSWALLCLVIAIMALAKGGLYASIDALLQTGGDSTDLIWLGVPRALVIGVGAVLVGIGIFLAVAAFRSIDFGADSSLIGRALVLEGGLLPYLLAIVAYQLVSSPQEIRMWGLYVAIGALIIFLIAVLSQWLESRFPARPGDRADLPGWTSAWAVIVVGIAIVGIELILF